jgi:hypothetical protein
MYLLMTLVQTMVIFGIAPAVVIFILAGRWDLWNVWVYAGISIAIWSFQAVAMHRVSPDFTGRILSRCHGWLADW